MFGRQGYDNVKTDRSPKSDRRPASTPPKLTTKRERRDLASSDSRALRLRSDSSTSSIVRKLFDEDMPLGAEACDYEEQGIYSSGRSTSVESYSFAEFGELYTANPIFRREQLANYRSMLLVARDQGVLNDLTSEEDQSILTNEFLSAVAYKLQLPYEKVVTITQSSPVSWLIRESNQPGVLRVEWLVDGVFYSSRCALFQGDTEGREMSWELLDHGEASCHLDFANIEPVSAGELSEDQWNRLSVFLQEYGFDLEAQLTPRKYEQIKVIRECIELRKSLLQEECAIDSMPSPSFGAAR